MCNKIYKNNSQRKIGNVKRISTTETEAVAQSVLVILLTAKRHNAVINDTAYASSESGDCNEILR